MDFLDFKIEDMRHGWADVSFIFDEITQLFFTTSYICQSFTNLATALIENRNHKDVQKVEFNLESSSIDLLLINYPGDILKVQFYQDMFWDGAFDELPKQPSPPEVSFFTDWHTFTFRIVDELTKHTEEEFATAGFSYPKEQIKILRKKMVGSG